MRLKHIKLSGFKSFVDTTKVAVPNNLVGIVGPNGCGKSNVIDAIRWVMGESSAKTLRGASMDDVIFNGSAVRKPVNRAYVELVFDNTDGTAPGSYAKFGEIAIRRELARESGSKYFINKVRCRRKDISDIFEKEVEIYYRLSDKQETHIEEFRTVLKEGQIKTELIKAEIKANSNVQILEAFPRLMYFPPDIVRQTYLLNKNLKDVSFSSEEYSIKDEILDFRTEDEEEISKIWDSILGKTKDYRIEENNCKLQIANAAIGGNGKLQQAIKNYTDWKDKIVNPIKILSENLKEFLDAFNVKIALEIQNTNDLQFIRFEPLHENGYEVPSKYLSTGTKQIVLKTLPFLGVTSDEQEVAPLNTIILMDEPENSLYPDRQYKLVEHFENLTENCQFFYATHSPIIASTFEPCERFILEFENGFVKVKKGISPEGVPVNKILQTDYRTEILQGKAKKEWYRYLDLCQEYDDETSENNKKRLAKIINEIELKYPFFKNH